MELKITGAAVEQVIRMTIWRAEELYEAAEENEELLPGGIYHEEFMTVNAMIDEWKAAGVDPEAGFETDGSYGEARALYESMK